MSGRMKVERAEKLEGLLQDLLIVELAKAGINQTQIRQILGIDMWRVSRIARHFKKRKR